MPQPHAAAERLFWYHHELSEMTTVTPDYSQSHPEVGMDDACSNADPVYYEMTFFAPPSPFLPPSLKVTCNKDL